MPCRRLILSILGAWGIVLSNSSSAAGLATVKRCQSKTLAYSPRSSGDWLPWRWSLAVSSSTNVGDDTQVDFGNSPEPLPLQQPLTTALLRVSYDGMHFTGWSCANDNANDSSPIDHASSGRLVVAPLGSSRRRRRRDIRRTFSNDSPGFVRSVQGEIRSNLARLYGDVDVGRVIVEGCSRTDKGVHAKGMVAQIYCLTELAYAETKSPRTSNMTDNVLPYPLQQSIPGRRIPHPWNATDTTCFLTLPKPLPELISALNRMMIPDVQIMAVSAVPFTSSSLLPFHPTLSARRKTYRYTFSVGHRHDPIMSRTVWHLQDSALGSTWNEASVYQAGEMMCGLHRFAAFQGAPRGADDKRKRVHQNTLCTIDSINLRAASKADKTVTYTVDITGDRFLYKMVRLMTGALVAVGQGKLTLRNVEHLLSSDTRGNAPEFECAPAHGLVLYHVQYDDPIDWQSALS